jgi:Type VI secretion system (T6SS), amidase effector protein 4
MAEIPVDWGVLMLNHPSYLDIGNKVKGIPKGWETCCIQISFALNKSGAPIRNKGGMVGLQSGRDNFIIRVSTMRDYLDDEFGEAENYVGGARIAKISQIIRSNGHSGVRRPPHGSMESQRHPSTESLHHVSVVGGKKYAGERHFLLGSAHLGRLSFCEIQRARVV